MSRRKKALAPLMGRTGMELSTACLVKVSSFCERPFEVERSSRRLFDKAESDSAFEQLSV